MGELYRNVLNYRRLIACAREIHCINSSVIHLVADVEARDRYRRLLAYVYRDLDGAFVNLLLVEEGYAVPYTYPPNVAHADDFVAAAGRARDERRGLWSRCR